MNNSESMEDEFQYFRTDRKKKKSVKDKNYDRDRIRDKKEFKRKYVNLLDEYRNGKFDE